MMGAATGDLHLGYRAYSANFGGRNVREMDVEAAWLEVVKEVIALRPHLLTIAGDIFQHPRVGMWAVKAWRDGIRSLSEAGIPTVALIGNHDAGRTLEALTPVLIPDDLPNFHVATGPTGFFIPLSSGELAHVACFPFHIVGETLESRLTYEVKPDPKADVNILVMHAAVRTSADPNALPYFYGGVGALDVGRIADEWDVIHCGDYHAFNRLHPERLAFYAGAPECTTTNVWEETDPRGFVTYDTLLDPPGNLTHHELENRGIDSYRMEDATAEDVNAALTLANSYLGNVEGRVVRLVIAGFPPEERPLIDWAAVRALKAKALHFELHLESTESDIALGSPRAAGMTLEERAAEFYEDTEPAVRACIYRHLGFRLTEGDRAPAAV